MSFVMFSLLRSLSGSAEYCNITMSLADSWSHLDSKLEYEIFARYFIESLKICTPFLQDFDLLKRRFHFRMSCDWSKNKDVLKYFNISFSSIQ